MHRFARVIAAVTVAHGVIGFWVATNTPAPLLSADDVGYLGLARTLVGDGGVPLPVQPPYGLLYPVLLAPGWAVGLDESSMITFARVVNAALGAILVPLLYLLIRRISDADRGLVLMASVGAASLPAAMLHSSIVWTENLLPVVVVLGLLSLHHFGLAVTSGRGALVVALAIAQVATHPRSAVAAAVLVGFVVWIAARARRRGLAVALAVMAGVLYLLVELARRAVQDAAYGSPGLYDAADLIDRRGFDEVSDMVVLGLGTMAYLVLATASVAIVGAVALWRTGLVGRASVGLVGATIVMAGWFLTGVPRADKWLHGRYVEAVAAPLVALGLIGLARWGWRRMTILVAAPVVAGVFAAWAGPGDNWSRPRSPVMMLGVEPGGAPFGSDRFEPGAAALVALASLLILWLLARRRPALVMAALAPLLVLGTLSGLRTLDDLYDGSVPGEVDTALPSDVDRIAIDPTVATGISIATAWRVGLDSASISTATEGVSHVLLPEGAVPPDAAVEVSTVTGAVFYRLER